MRIHFFVFAFILSLLLNSHNSVAQADFIKQYLDKESNFFEVCRKVEKKFNKIERKLITQKAKSLPEMNSNDDPGKARLRYERWKWYWRDRVDENGQFPDMQRQWVLYNYFQKSSNANLRSIENWKHEGPVRNTGGYWGMGRTTHIAFHPNQANTYFIASPNGGLWKTTDDGRTYTSITENIPYQPVGVVIVDHQNPNNMYISLGEKDGWWQYSMGVYKTTDGGKTWNPTALNFRLSDKRVIYGMEMNPLNPNVLIVATSSGLFKTFDGGRNWTRVRTENFSDVKYKPGDTSVVYAAINDYWGACNILKSSNGGNTFVMASSFNFQKAFFRLATTDADPNYLGINMSVDGARKFYLSQNSGTSYEYVSDMPENAIMAFSQINKQIMYCGFVVAYQSTDGGKTWNQITDWWASGRGYPEIHADQRWLGFHPKRKNEAFFCNDGGIYRFNETTKVWTEMVNGLAITQFYKMAISNTAVPALIGGSQDNGGFIKRSNGSWGNTNGGDAMDQEIDPTNANIGYTEYWGGTAVYRTFDGFRSLEEITNNIPGKPQGQWVTPFTLNPKNPKSFYIGYEDVFVSYDRGTTFRKLSNNLTGSVDRDLRELEINPLDTNHIVASSGNILYYSFDYGRNWKSVTLTGDPEISGIAFSTKDPNRMWLCRSVLGNLRVFESKNKGVSWSNISKNFVNIPASCILFDQVSNSLFIGTDIGVFFSDVDQINWEYYGKAMPHTSVTDLEIHHQTRTMYASTYGRGFFSIPLPECYPGTLNLNYSVNGGNQIFNDTVSLCLGDKLVLQTLPGVKGNFQWIGPGLDTSMTDTGVLVLNLSDPVKQSGMYTVKYSSQSNCKREQSIFVILNANPEVELDKNAKELHCNQKSLLLKNDFRQDPNLNYQWYESGNFLGGTFEQEVTKAGKYALRISNQLNRCINTDTIEVISWNDPEVMATTTPVKCYGYSDGKIHLNITKGKPPYQILYNQQIADTLISVLPAGDYTILVKDKNECQDTVIASILSPDSINIKLDFQDWGNGLYDVDAVIKGGVGPYDYIWSRGLVVLTKNERLINRPPGEYSLQIIDANGCTKIIVFQIKETVNNDDPANAKPYLYPNPASGFVSLSNVTRDQISLLDFYSIEGKKIPYKTKWFDRQIQISWPSMAPCVAVLKFTMGNVAHEFLIEIKE